jgi:hypothetical protein
MALPKEQLRLDEAFERIEGTILPCISMMLDSLIAVTSDDSATDARVIAAELQTLACEVEELTRAVERTAEAQKRGLPLRSAA